MNPSEKRHHIPYEQMHLSNNQHNKIQPTKSHSAATACAATSATMPTVELDDYGECDVSLASYKSDSASLHRALSLEEANELLCESLKKYPLFTKSQTTEGMMAGSCPPLKSYNFTAGHDLRIKVEIQIDVQKILFSTVVHKLKQPHASSPPQSRGYSLLTKMMKYNAILGQINGGGRVVNTSEGSFLFFRDVDIGAFCAGTRGCGKLSEVFEDFLLKAMEIRLDFDQSKNVQKPSTVGVLR